MVNVVLVEPEIPQNTGNIARTCAATGMSLHLVRPMMFEITESRVKRAGLDYWHLLTLTYHENLAAFLNYAGAAPLFFCSTKADKLYTEVSYPDGCYLLFGKETKGLPESLIFGGGGTAVRIPMLPALRSLNLSNAAAIIGYEALRQQGFKGMV